jgi:formylglycine-generating enzyme required for sulfatase activity
MGARKNTDPFDLVGRTIDDKYLVESMVGEGGFSTVYRAKHVTWGRPVALKVLRGLAGISATDREQFLQAFIREGSLLADLSERSAAICQARDLGMLTTQGGESIPYMVLEWLEGVSLAEALEVEKAQGRPPRSIGEAVHLLDPAAKALAMAHRRGIAHRDIKPANIFIVGDPRSEETTVKLLDFGIAKVVADAWKESGGFARTTGKVSAFTPSYGAPEQFSRKHGATGPWTDVFALALVVVEIVTGKDPLEGDDIAELALAASNVERRPTPRTRGVAVPDAVEEVFRRALAVKPEERHPTAGAFWNELRDALHLPPMLEATGPDPLARHVIHSRSSRTASAAQPTRTESASVPSTSSSRAPPLVVRRRRTVAILAIVAAAILVVAAVATRGLGHGNGAKTSGSTPLPVPVASSVADPDRTACPPGMVSIPGGPFFMGNDEGTPMERPSHPVRLSPFCIDVDEVTVGRYKTCSDAGKCKRAFTTNAWATLTDGERAAFDPLCNARDATSRANHPVNCIDWDMADAFCTAQGRRLPTEAEWELAARGQDGRRYPWGDEEPSAVLLNACGIECAAWGKAHHVDETEMYDADDGWPSTAPVGTFPKGSSPYGLHDVAGNVWEWVADWYGEYPKDKQDDPAGPASGQKRVVRGGAWNGSRASWVRPTFRYASGPSERSYAIGFRCAE